MSITPHPTIEGVTVESYQHPACVTRALAFGRYKVRADNNKEGIVLWFAEISAPDAETVIAMIRDQAAWLAAQGATT